MRRIIAGLDIGTNELKLVVGEILKNKLNVLACVDVKSQGIKKGYVVNPESASVAFLELFKKAETVVGLPINKVITVIPSLYAECYLSEGSVVIKNEDFLITNKDILRVMQKMVGNDMPINRELVTVLPAGFRVNDGEVIANPLNMMGEKLSGKGIVVTVPKKNIDNIKFCLRKVNVEVVDVVISSLADYSILASKEDNEKIGALVNIGEDETCVSIFNRGILTNLEMIDIGSSNIDNDISYVYKINKEDSRYIKEHLCLATCRLAQPNESYSLTDNHGEQVKINQYDASEIAESRLNEIMNLIKKQINLLTKRKLVI